MDESYERVVWLDVRAAAALAAAPLEAADAAAAAGGFDGGAAVVGDAAAVLELHKRAREAATKSVFFRERRLNSICRINDSDKKPALIFQSYRVSCFFIVCRSSKPVGKIHCYNSKIYHFVTEEMTWLILPVATS